MAKGSAKLTEALAKVDELGAKASAAAKRATEVGKQAREAGATELVSAAVGGGVAAALEEYNYGNMEMGDAQIGMGGAVVAIVGTLAAPKVGKAGKELKALALGAAGFTSGRLVQQQIRAMQAEAKDGAPK